MGVGRGAVATEIEEFGVVVVWGDGVRGIVEDVAMESEDTVVRGKESHGAEFHSMVVQVDGIDAAMGAGGSFEDENRRGWGGRGGTQAEGCIEAGGSGANNSNINCCLWWRGRLRYHFGKWLKTVRELRNEDVRGSGDYQERRCW